MKLAIATLATILSVLMWTSADAPVATGASKDATSAENPSSTAPADLGAMLGKVRNGGTIDLGNRPVVNIPNMFQPSKEVVIKGGVFPLTSLDTWKNVTFEGSTFRAQDIPVEHNALLVAYAPENLTIRNCHFIGYRAPDGELRGRVSIRGGTNVTIEKSVFEQLSGFIAFNRTTNGRFVDNVVHTMREGVNVVGGSNIEIARNVFYDFQPWADDHADGVQMFTTGLKSETELATRDVTIENNLILAAGKAQGIFITDDYGFESAGKGYKNFRIANNLIVGAVWHGITATSMDGLTIGGNTLLRVAGRDKADARITASGTTVTLKENVANDYIVHGDVRQESNKRVGEMKPDGAEALISRWLQARQLQLAR